MEWPRLTFSSIQFEDLPAVEIGPRDTTILVGANNCGKSQVLKDLLRASPKYGVSGVIVSKATMKWEEGSKNISEFLATHGKLIREELGYRRVYEGYWGETSDSAISQCLSGIGPYGNGPDIMTVFAHFVTTIERLSGASTIPAISLSRKKPSRPLHAMYRDDALEEKISSAFREAFDLDLIVHRGDGEQIPLHVGKRPIRTGQEDRVSLSYVQKVEALPCLDTQGDGMRSFASLLLACCFGARSMLFIDEPECFLHPPQIRVLARFLAKEASDKQLWIATHSGDFIRAVIDAKPEGLRVIRLQREGNSTTPYILDPGRMSQLWADPLLRHSNLLDGLFHERVVLCEADSDCRFYQAIASANNLGRDAMFCHTGGKHRLKTAAKALRALKVPTKVIADFDLLREQNILHELVEAVGGLWEAIEKDWKVLEQAVRNGMPQRSLSDFQDNVNKILGAEKTSVLSPKTRIAIEREIEASKPAAKLKASGKHAVPHGQPAAACDSLLASLKAMGIHVVPNGELESFYRNAGGHGPDWVNEVLALDLESHPSLAEARSFVGEVLC